MTDSRAKSDLRGDLQMGRDAMLWKLEGLSEYDMRRPMTPTGTTCRWLASGNEANVVAP